MKLKHSILFILSLLGTSLLGQNVEITDQIINDLIVCDTGTVQYSFKSAFSDELDNVEVQIALPQGVVYVAGTINGAIEKNISNLRVPIFEINKLSKGRKVDITVDLALNCEARELIDMSVDFVDTLSIQHTKGSQIYRSSRHDIKTPHLVLTVETPLIFNIAPYQTVQRKHTIKNTKRGRLKQFRFVDTHSDCSVRALNGNEIVNTSTQLVLELGANDFAQIGNRDIYFDQNEEIIIIEEIRYEKDCEIGILNFNIVADWGCDGDVCQDQSEQLTARVNEKYGKAKLELTAEVTFPNCPCDIYDAKQCLLIENTGTSIADSITLDVEWRDRSGPNGILDKHFWYNNKQGDSIPLRIIFKEEKECESIYKRYILELPSIEVRDSLKINWYYTLCSAIEGKIEHDPFLLEWKPLVLFKDKCGDDFRQSALIWQGTRLPDFKITAFPVNQIIGHGEYFPFENEFKSDVLTKFKNGQLTLIYIVPCGYSLSDNDFKLEGKLPVLIDSSSKLFYRVTYELPFKSNIIRDTVFAKFDCLDSCLDSTDFLGYYKQNTSCPGQNSIFRAKMKSNICVVPLFSNCPVKTKADICGYLSTGVGINHEVFCDTGDSLEVDIPGYVDFQGVVERTTFGLKDDDNDRYADIPLAKANKELIDLQLLIETDTFKITLKGQVKSDFPNLKFDSLYVAFDVNVDLFKLFNNKISIFDYSEQTWYYCSSDSFDIDTGSLRPLCGQTVILRPPGRGTSIIYHPNYLKTRGCGVPLDFYFEEEDSVIVDLEFVVDASLSNYPNGWKEIVSCGMFLYDNDFDHYAFTCGHFSDQLTLVKSVYKYTFVDVLNIQACKPSNADHYFKLIPNPGKESKTNYFPYEYRNIMYLKNFQITMDKAITVDSFVVRYLYKDSVPFFDIEIAHETVESFRVNDTTWRFEHELSTSFDDGYEIIIEPFVSVKDCHDLVDGLNSIKETATITTQNVPPLFYFDKDDRSFFKRRGVFRKKISGLKPLNLSDFQQLSIIVPQRYNPSVDNKGRWSADVILDDSLKFFKFKVINMDSGLCNVRIKDDNGNVYLERNGEILVDKYPPNTIKNLTIIADNKSCELQHLDIISAWACDSIGDFFDMACAIDTFYLSVKADTPRLDLSVKLINNPYELCDTLDYIEIEITNADKGATFDLVLDMMTSNGFNYIDSKTVYSLDNSTTFKLMPIPKLVNNNHYQWNLTDLIPEFIENGFPGIRSNNHVITIRVFGTLDCDFEPGSLFTIEIKGLNNCGNTTNTLKISETVNIDGVSTNNNTIDLVATATPSNLLCTENSSITITYSTTDDFSDEDEINVSLPLGMVYVSGSLISINNFTVIFPVITIKNGVQNLKWNANEVSIGKTDISFRFDIHIELEALECELQMIDVKISHESNVFCKTSGDSCFVNLIAGMTSVPLTIEKGEVELIEIIDFEQLDDSTIHVCIKIIGKLGFLSNWTDSLIFNLYDDHKNDGRTADDHLLGTASDLVVMHIGDAVIVCLDFEVLIVDTTCHYVIELPNTKNCICSPEILEFDQSLSSKKKAYTLCPLQKTDIGSTLQVGQTYNWEGIDLPCTDCPSFEITHTFDRDTSFTRTYTLTISDSVDCDYQWIYEITFLPSINLDLIDFEVCLGDSIILSLDGFSTVVWSGIGIEDVKGSPVTIFPSESGLFRVNWVDQNGCHGEDSFNIILHNVDTLLYEISNDTTIDLGDEADLWIKGEGTFEWRPDLTLNCSDCSEVIATPSITTTYTVIITDINGCQTSRKVTVFIRELPCDPINVFVPNAFSPNGDLHNDSLFVRGNYFDEMHFMIYDRWGEKVFETTDQNIPWLGEYNNRTLGPDVYSYYLKVRCLNGEYLVKKGNVSIIK